MFLIISLSQALTRATSINRLDIIFFPQQRKRMAPIYTFLQSLSSERWIRTETHLKTSIQKLFLKVLFPLGNKFRGLFTSFINY